MNFHRPPRYSKRRATLGVTLIELIISLGVFSIVLVSMAKIMSAGYEQYWVASGSLEVQKAALIGAQRLVKDLTQSNMTSVEITDPLPRPVPSTPVFDTIVFAYPSDLTGNRHYSERGLIEWQSFVGYYTTTSGGVTSLIRNMIACPTPGVPVPIPSDQSVGIAQIMLQPSAQIILRGVGNFDLVQKEDLIQIELMGIFEQRGTFTITVKNQAFPRN